jgi:hypothetical protein
MIQTAMLRSWNAEAGEAARKRVFDFRSLRPELSRARRFSIPALSENAASSRPLATSQRERRGRSLFESKRLFYMNDLA